ncbi:cytochrome c oxidase subunit 2 [Nitrosomonas communis]|uniref:Cytochrome aa3 subunit 2 n=1 Tax=Nitrosomonas communis TaxID=44574 RepID=A0A1I4KHA2_9PROT|nr:cytochrome c oxidase subunit 2 [Nitrosomonas communis]
MRYLELFIGDNKSGFNINANGVVVNHLSSQKAGDGYQHSCQQRDMQTPRVEAAFTAITQQPVERSECQRHDGQQCMNPGNKQGTNTRYKYQVNQAGNSCQPATQTAQASQPQAYTYPERVICVQINQIGTYQSKQEGNRKMNQHGMNWVSTNRHTADNRLLCHGYAPRQKLRIKTLTINHSLVLLEAIIILFFLVGCSGPQSALNPAGPSAHAIANLWWGMLGFFALVLLTIVALWLYAMWRKPISMTKAQARKMSSWWIIGGGVALPIISIITLLSFSIPMGFRMLPLPLEEQTPLRIEVTARQWLWQIRYADTRVITMNELHLPAGMPIDVHVNSADVIHSFWVPRLSGKIDVIPGRTNILRLQADAPGRFRGQCSEFCGRGHAHMILSVVVHTPEEFEAWLEEKSYE